MGISAGGNGGHQSQINVTPLVDVVLVLLIIFMVIVPIAQRAYDLDVPVQAGVAPVDPGADEQIVLTVSAAGCPTGGALPESGLPRGCRVRLGTLELPVVDLAAAAARLYAVRDADRRVLFLAAEDDLEYELVMRVVDLARLRTPELRIALATEVPRG